MSETLSTTELTDRARTLIQPGQRRVLGITGSPGAGKSWLASHLAQQLAAEAQLVEMDGFHLENTILDRLGIRDRKGAPETFDAQGFVSLLRDLRESTPTRAPRFDRQQDVVVPEAVFIPAEVPLIIVEGNYLLVDVEPWSQIRSLLDECWFIDVDPELRQSRLARRHVSYGRSPAEALERTMGSDEANAIRIEETRPAADLVVRIEPNNSPTH